MGDGDDLVRLVSGLATVSGEAGNDRFEIWASGSNADGGGGDDLFFLYGGNGLDLRGGIGADRFVFEAALTNVHLDGGDGDDEFAGGGFASSGEVFGDRGNDRFSGFGAGMILDGGPGDDRYRLDSGLGVTIVEPPRNGTDTVEVPGGTGYVLPAGIENLVVYGPGGAAVTLTGSLHDNKIVGGDGDETILGLDGNDTLYGNGGADLIDGGRGNDLINGGGGNDVLVGGEGNDRLNGGTGDDRMTGGTGDDSYHVDSAGDVVVEAAGEGIDTLYSIAPSYALPDNVENGVVESASGVRLDGNGGDNVLTGGQGDDTLGGLAGNDRLSGGNGNDVLTGGSGDDVLLGEGGNDRLQGDAGADLLTGGTGADRFVFALASDSNESGFDRITDFTPGDGDVIDLSAIDANIAVDGNQAFTWAQTTPTANALWYSYVENSDGSWEVVWFADVNGDTIPEFELHVHQIGFLTIGSDLIL